MRKNEVISTYIMHLKDKVFTNKKTLKRFICVCRFDY